MPSTISATSKTAVAAGWAARAAFATATALYVVVLDTSTTKLRVFRSTDGTTWSEQNSANAVSVVSTNSAFSAWKHTDGYLYIAYFSASGTINVRRFNTANDTWETSDLGTGSAATNGSDARTLRVVVRSDGDVLVFYTDNVGSNNLRYARREGTTWTSSNSVKAASARLWDMVIDSSDRAYLPYGDDQNNDNTIRTLTSANTLNAEVDFDTTAHTTDKPFSSNLALWNDGTNNKVGLLGRDTGGEYDFYHFTEADAPTITTVNAVTTSTTPQTTTCGVDVFNSKVWAVWAEANAIKYDSTTSLATLTFGTDQTLLSGLTDTDPCPQLLVGLGGLGAVYNDGGTVKVEWISAPVTAKPSTSVVWFG